MSYSLETTKRKFHRILDSLANSSSTSLPDPSTVPALVPPSKRARLAPRPHSVAASSLRSSLDRARVLRLPSGTTAPAPRRDAPVPIEQDAAFRPWDRAQFLARLKTFSGRADRWAPKSDRIGEVTWAKRGWACVERETVRCAACRRRVHIDLRITVPGRDDAVDEEGALGGEDGDGEDWRDAALEGLVQRYERMITDEHGAECFWRTRGCDASIQRLPLAHPRSSLSALSDRYTSILPMQKSMPSRITLPGALDSHVLLSQFKACVRYCFPTDPTLDVPEANDTHNAEANAFAFALLGWRGDTSISIKGSDIISCEACFRRCGLWIWRPRNAPTGDGAEGAPEFLADQEHLAYCPWINAATQNAGRAGAEDEDEPAGWQALARLVATTARSLQTDVPAPNPPGTPETVGTASGSADTREKRDAKDRERWAKLKKLRKVFSVKRLRKSEKENEAPSAARKEEAAP